MLTKINEKYKHEETGITCKIWGGKSVRLLTNDNKREFIFDKSSPITIRKVAEAMIELCDYIDTQYRKYQFDTIEI